jgi:HSP20 family protein
MIFRDMEELMRASPQDTLVRGFTIERKPLIDVMKDDDAVTVIVEMSGVEKEDIDIKASETHVEINAEGEDRKYSEKVDLGCKIIPDSHKARYNNGVLEIVFKRNEDEEEEMKKVNVE